MPSLLDRQTLRETPDTIVHNSRKDHRGFYHKSKIRRCSFGHIIPRNRTGCRKAVSSPCRSMVRLYQPDSW